MGKGQDNSPEIDALNDKISELEGEITELKEKNEEEKNTNYNKGLRIGYKVAEQRYMNRVKTATFVVLLFFIALGLPFFRTAFQEWDMHPIFKIIIGILFFLLLVSAGIFLIPDERDVTLDD